MCLQLHEPRWFVIQALKELSTKGGLCSDEWQEKDGLVLYRGKIYIPWDNKLRFNIIKSHHNYPVAGHPGWWKTTELVACNCWCQGWAAMWQTMWKAVTFATTQKPFQHPPPVSSCPPNPWSLLASHFWWSDNGTTPELRLWWHHGSSGLPV